MHRTKKDKPELRLKRRLELVRTTIRELTPAELERVAGGYTTTSVPCSNPYTVD